MKVNDNRSIPGKTIEKHLEVNYQYDASGNFTWRAGYDYLKHEDLLVHDVWRLINEKIEEARQKVVAGEVSPIAYHMERCLMELPTLSSIAGIPSWRIRRHLRVKSFRKLKPSILKKYADAFEISVQQLSQVK